MFLPSHDEFVKKLYLSDAAMLHDDGCPTLVRPSGTVRGALYTVYAGIWDPFFSPSFWSCVHVAANHNKLAYIWLRTKFQYKMSLKLLQRPVLFALRTCRKQNNGFGVLQKVCLSSNTPSSTDDKDKQSDESKWNVITSAQNFAAKNTRGVVIGSSVLVAFGITRGLYGLTYSFLSLTPYQAMYYGFMGGVIATGTTAGLMYAGEQAYHLNPNRAVRAAMRVLYNNPEVKAILGGSMHASSIRSYSSTRGGFGIRKLFPTWVHPEIQVAFTVQGSSGEALVTSVYRKKGVLGTEALDYVGLEWVDKNTGHAVTLTLRGDSSKFTIKNTLRPHGIILGKKYLQER